jgi:hypothetical protein
VWAKGPARPKPKIYLSLQLFQLWTLEILLITGETYKQNGFHLKQYNSEDAKSKAGVPLLKTSA